MHDLTYAPGSDPNQRYRTGHSHPEPFFSLTDESGDVHVYLGPLELGINATAVVPSQRTVIEHPAPKLPAAEAAVEILARHGCTPGAELLVPPETPVVIADALRAAQYQLSLATPDVAARVCKHAGEVAHITHALAGVSAAYERIEALLAAAIVQEDNVLYLDDAPLSSERVKRVVERVLIEHDLRSTEGMIIAGGTLSALPHHKGSGPLRAGEPIVCDIYPCDSTTGYYGDLTRTYVKGEPSAELARMYDAVATAQARAIAAIAPGVTGAEVHQVCVDTFTECGFATDAHAGFIHSTGHGLGLALHEEPRLSLRNTSPLPEGAVVTVEPGLYYPALGGVRLEDVVVVTKNGASLLPATPHRFAIQ